VIEFIGDEISTIVMCAILIPNDMYLACLLFDSRIHANI